jgi:hypothetical protein
VFEDVARARARESALLRRHGHSCAAVYLAGYVVECRLKTLLDRQGKKFSRSGTTGHDLVGLWDAAGLRFQDLSGHKLEFIRFWKTDLRYEAVLPRAIDVDNLLRGGTELAGMVATRIRYTRPARGRRRP